MTRSNPKLESMADRGDDDIDDSDTPALDGAFFREAKRIEPVAKSQITMRLDSDVPEWFRSQGKGDQTRINTVLKAYMRSQPK